MLSSYYLLLSFLLHSVRGRGITEVRQLCINMTGGGGANRQSEGFKVRFEDRGQKGRSE